jgi:hypothetical protein
LKQALKRVFEIENFDDMPEGDVVIGIRRCRSSPGLAMAMRAFVAAPHLVLTDR